MNDILGIDVAKAKLDIALRRPDGKLRSKVVDNTPQGFVVLSAWLLKQGVTELHACMEATGTYWEAVAEYLVDAGFKVSVVNPAQIKAFGTAQLVRTKTDKADARLIAEFCAAQRPESWQAPAPAIRELRALVARRNTLDTMRTQEKNRLPVAREAVRAGIAAHLDYLEQAIADIEALIREKIDKDPGLKQQREARLHSRIGGQDHPGVVVLLRRGVALCEGEGSRGLRRLRSAPARVGQQCARTTASI